MADGDFDLDAMLDSALDEEFDAPATAAEAGGENDGELDLDAMLDEALDGEAAAAPVQKQSVVASEKTSGAARASSGFGASQQWLQRKQGGGAAGGGMGRGGATEAFPFLRAERREAWKAALAEDGLRQADADKQRPLSRAYRSFYSVGKEDGAVVVHLGSGAAAPAAAATRAAADGVGGGSQGHNAGAVGGAGAGGDGEEGSGGVASMFEDVLGHAVLKSEMEPPSLEEADHQPLERLKVSYLRLVAKDVRARVSKDPDASPDRFPGIASKILA